MRHFLIVGAVLLCTACAHNAAVMPQETPAKTAAAPKATPPKDNPEICTPEHPKHDMSGMKIFPNGGKGDEQIVIVLYPGFTALDMVGPQYMFAAMFGAKIHLAAKTLDPVQTDTGFFVHPTITFADAPKKPDVLMVPGSGMGVFLAMKDAEIMAFIHDRGVKSKYVTSVCTGSLLLGAAGLLDGYKATSHWAGVGALDDFGATYVNKRVVEDRNRITAAGVSAGLDFGLYMVQKFRGTLYAQSTQLTAEYDPQPPLDAGSLEKAPPAARELMQGMFKGFDERAVAAGREAYTRYAPQTAKP